MKTREKFKLEKQKSAHLIGVGGKGLKGIAEVLIGAGWKVSGSDEKDSKTLSDLKLIGVDARVGHDVLNVPPDVDVIVTSSIISLNNPEIAFARASGIPILNRAEFLGEIFKNFPLKIAVAGSHGKSTTTTLLGLTLESAGINPTVFGGAPCIEKGDANGWVGSKYCAVVESCEFKRAFLSLPADYTIVTSYEHAHPECFPKIEDMAQAFLDYFKKHKSNSTLILDADAIGLKEVAERSGRNFLTVGFIYSADYRIISGATLNERGVCIERCAVYRPDGSVIGAFATELLGSHNQKNIAYVAVLLDLLGLDPESLLKTLETFRGVRRRFETKQTSSGVVLVNDFAHHPTQTAHAVSTACTRWPDRELLVVFEPKHCKLVHRFLREYGGAFRGAKKVVVTNPVPALNDTLDEILALPIESVVEAVQNKSGVEVSSAKNYLDAVNEVKNFVSKVGSNRATVVTIGPGDIFKVNEILEEAYSIVENVTQS